MKLPALLLFLISLPICAKTYDFSNRFGVGAGGGFIFPIQGNEFDSEIADGEVIWGAHMRYHTTPEDSLQLNYSHYEFEMTDINARIFDLMYLYRFNEGDKLTPVLGIGAGAADMDNIEPFNDSLKFAARARAGFEYALTDDLVATLYADYQYIGKMPHNTEDKADDDEGFPGREVFAVVPQIGITYFFGPDKEIKEDLTTDPASAPAAAPVLVPVVIPVDSSASAEDFKAKEEQEQVTMTLHIHFPEGKSLSDAETIDQLDELGRFLNEHPEKRVEVQGHSDNIEINGKELSQRRADAVKFYLIEKLGIAPERISAYGYGDTLPEAPNSSPEGRAKNRRVIAIISE